MYYTIEGKRVLSILYLLGALLGAAVINLGMKNGFFHFYDFADYTAYLSSMTGDVLGGLFSYVVILRIRQLLLFVAGVFLLSPYVTYCILTFVFSVTLSGFVSLMTIRYGILGMPYTLLFLMPQAIFYGIMLFSAYHYIFQTGTGSLIYRKRGEGQGRLTRVKKLMDQKLFVAILCIAMFVCGCLSEGYLNPVLIRHFLPM